jgi:hypothetical protein
MYRQGDLLFVKKGFPQEAQKSKSNIIERGEVTGHAHRLRRGNGATLAFLAGVAYLKVLTEALVDHEEHDTITLPEGDWEVRRQREYEPRGWRTVAD